MKTLLILSSLLLLTVTTFGQQKKTPQKSKPNKEETQRWILEKLNSYSSSYIKYGEEIFNNYKFTFENDNLQITFASHSSEHAIAIYDTKTSNNYKVDTYAKNIIRVSVKDFGRDEESPGIFLILESSPSKLFKIKGTRSATDKNGNPITLSIPSNIDYQDALVKIPFNISGEKDLENRLKTAFQNLGNFSEAF